MKTIKIFLASSEELDNDRMAFGNLVRRLDDMYEKRGIRIKLFEWEDYDAAFNDRRKQDEYNNYVRQSDVFLALFHKKAGKFTIEEFNVASEEFKTKTSPKVYTYCKDLQPGEEETPELIEFKKHLFDEMGHYWCRYDSRESLQLQFVMQLQLVESSQMKDLKVENGEVMLDGLRIAKMDKLKFAAANEDYVKAQQELNELHDEIEEIQLSLEKKQQKMEKKKAKLEKDPDDEDYQEEYLEVKEEVDELIDKLQPKLNKYNKLKEEFAEYQTLLLNSAKRVAQLQGERITERMRRAMDAFNEGKVREANIILDEAEADARKNLEDYKQSKEITELKRQAVISSIDELLLKTSTIMADASIPIEESIEQTEKIYAQADEIAGEIEYEKEKHIDLLFKYGYFLSGGDFEFDPDEEQLHKALNLFVRIIQSCEQYYGTEHHCTADAYNWAGNIMEELEDISSALIYTKKTLDIREKVLGSRNREVALTYNAVGSLYRKLGEIGLALKYKEKGLAIMEEVSDVNHIDIARFFRSVGDLYHERGNNELAIYSYQKALHIAEKLLGNQHDETARLYYKTGTLYLELNNRPLALEYYNKILAIPERLGAISRLKQMAINKYNNISQ